MDEKQASLMADYICRNVGMRVDEKINREFQHCLEFHSPAYEYKRLVTSCPCRLFQFWGNYKNADTDVWLLVFNSDRAVPDGTVPLFQLRLQADTNFSTGLVRSPIVMQKGIYLALSTTPEVLTISTSADAWFNVQYLHDIPYN